MDSNTDTMHATNFGGLTLPSPKERVLMKREAQVLSFGEDLGEALIIGVSKQKHDPA